MLPPAEIEANAARFLEQVSMVLRVDPEVFEVRRNSEWFATMDVAGLIGLFAQVTHAQLTARDMFRERIAAGREIGLHELVYPVPQAFDSVEVGSDLTIVGSDQLFNETMGRQLQQRLGRDAQTVVTTTITPGLDGGAKQSKSLGNYVALTDAPDEKFGKLMSLPDDLVGSWAHVYTDLPLDVVRRLGAAAESGGAAARDAELDLAEAVVARYHGSAAAAASREAFTRVFSDRTTPADLPDLVVAVRSLTVLELVRLAHPRSSNGDLRRLVSQGAVLLNGERLTDAAQPLTVSDGDVLRSGRRQWHRLRVS